MSTTISTPSANSAKMRWMEPYVSDGLNAKLNGIIPAGVVRGGKLVTGGAALLVTIAADPIFGDSVYSYIDSNGRQLTFRQVGDVTLDLNVGGVPGTTVYIGLEITYVVSAATLVYWRAYSDAEVDANPYIVVLGRVVVPVLPGPIPVANITPLKRRDAWYNEAPGMRGWHQIVRNGSFDVANDGVLSNSDEEELPGWRNTSVSATAAELLISSLDSHTGERSLKIRGAALGTNYTYLFQESSFACRPGDKIRASFWVAGDSVSAGGFGDLCIYLNYYSEEALAIATAVLCQAGTEDGSFAWTEFSEVTEVPAGAYFVRAGVRARDTSGAATGAYYVDDVRVWIEGGNAGEDDLMERGLIGQIPGLSSLDIVPRGLSTTDMADWLAKNLRLRFDTFATPVYEYEWKHRHGLLPWLLKLVGGGVQIDRLIEGLGSTLVGSDVDAARARIKAPYRNSGLGYTLMYEFTQQGTKGTIRIYATYQAGPSGNWEAFVVTVNALWNASTNRWNRDQATRDSTRFDITSVSMKFYWYDDTLTDIWQDLEWATVGQETLELQGGASPYLRIPGAGSFLFDGSRDGNYITFTGGDGLPSTSPSSPIEPEWSRASTNRAYPEIASSAALFFNLNMLKNGDVIQDLTLFTYFSSGTAFDWELHEVEFKDPASAPTNITLASGTTTAGGAGWKTDAWTSLGFTVSKGALSPNLKAYYLLIWSPLTLGSLNFVAGGMVRYTTTKVYV